MTGAVQFRRVVLLAGSYADAAEAMPLALHLARFGKAEVLGVLAEDPSALELAGHLVMRGTWCTASAPGPERMRAAIRADARAFEARLARLAGAAAHGWQFRTERGTLPEIAARVAGHDDLVLLGYRRVLRVRGPVVALCSADGPDADMAQRLASGLAEAIGVGALALRVGAAPGNVDADARGTMAALQRKPGHPRQRTGGARSVRWLADEGAALRALDRLAPSAVIVDAGLAGLAAPAALRDLIATARCPVLMRAAPPQGAS